MKVTMVNQITNLTKTFQLKPGEMLVFDNWRLLHGRGAFQGKRKMAGAYINREDFLSAIREHELLKLK